MKQFLSICFCVCLVCSNFFVLRLWSLGFWGLQLSGALLIFPVSYIINDLLTEVYGFRTARTAIWTGFLMCLFISLISALLTKLPQPLYEDGIDLAAKFDALYSFVPRTMVGSLMAFVVGSLCNSMIMSRMKVASNGRYFGLRAIASTIGGELADSLVFFPIAYAGIIAAKEIIGLMAVEFVVKILYELLVLPLTAFLAKKLKAREHTDTFDRDISYNPFF